jgi:hypothetical protein
MGQSKSSRNSLTSTWVRTARTECYWSFVRANLQRLRDTVRRQGQWSLHHDNAPSHTSPVVSSPWDLAPSDFWLFPALKLGLKGTRITTVENIEWNVTAELREIPTVAGWIEQACARTRTKVTVAVCPTVTVHSTILGTFWLPIYVRLWEKLDLRDLFLQFP